MIEFLERLSTIARSNVHLVNSANDRSVPPPVSSGLYYYGYRFYSPNLGRWISRDPIREQGGRNLYNFVGNNMLNLSDYLGFQSMGLGYGTLPNPNFSPANNWPHDINPEVYEDNEWHHSKISLDVSFCEKKCKLDEQLKKVNQMLTTFSEFNRSQTFATIQVSSSGNSAGFTPIGMLDTLGSPIVGISQSAGVTLSGPGAGYAQQATTNSWHPLVGKRRWNATGATEKSTHTITITTEAYESMNNLAGLFDERFRRNAMQMWISYLNSIADVVVSNCDGRKNNVQVEESGPDNVPATPLPW